MLKDETEKGEVFCHIISWLDNTHDLRELFRDIRIQMKKQFDIYNKEIKRKYKLTDETVESAIFDMNSLFNGIDINPSQIPRSRLNWDLYVILKVNNF